MDWDGFSVRMLRNFVERYEKGQVQESPRLRFVDQEGRACPAAAFCGAHSARDFHRAAAACGHAFRGGALETLSRAFETHGLTPHAIYAECLLELAGRQAAASVQEAGLGEKAQV